MKAVKIGPAADQIDSPVHALGCEAFPVDYMLAFTCRNLTTAKRVGYDYCSAEDDQKYLMWERVGPILWFSYILVLTAALIVLLFSLVDTKNGMMFRTAFHHSIFAMGTNVTNVRYADKFFAAVVLTLRAVVRCLFETTGWLLVAQYLVISQFVAHPLLTSCDFQDHTEFDPDDRKHMYHSIAATVALTFMATGARLVETSSWNSDNGSTFGTAASGMQDSIMMRMM